MDCGRYSLESWSNDTANTNYVPHIMIHQQETTTKTRKYLKKKTMKMNVFSWFCILSNFSCCRSLPVILGFNLLFLIAKVIYLLILIVLLIFYCCFYWNKIRLFCGMTWFKSVKLRTGNLIVYRIALHKPRK